MEELMVKMEIIANRMVHHMAKAFLYLQVFLPAIRAKLKFDICPAIQTVMFFPVIFFHFSLFSIIYLLDSIGCRLDRKVII